MIQRAIISFSHFGLCDELGVWLSLVPFVLLKSQEVCVCQVQRKPCNKAERKRSARGKVKLPLTVTFNNMSKALWLTCVHFLKLLGLIMKSRLTIKERHPLD